MHHQRNGDLLGDGLQPGNVDLGGEAILAVDGADGQRQNIDAGLRHEFGGLVGIGLHGLCLVDGQLLLAACDAAQLTLDGHAGLVSVLHHADGALHILLEGIGGGVDHHGAEACVDGSLDAFKLAEVVGVQDHGHVHVLGDGAGGGHGVLLATEELHLGVADDVQHGQVQLLCHLGDGHAVGIGPQAEAAQRVVSGSGISQIILQRHQIFHGSISLIKYVAFFIFGSEAPAPETCPAAHPHLRGRSR